jgi:hypothetical protein
MGRLQPLEFGQKAANVQRRRDGGVLNMWRN